MRAVHIVAVVLVASLIVVTAGVLVEKWREGGGGAAEGGLLVVTSIPALADDVRLLACRDDNVQYIMEPGANPHEYQLKPSDYDLIARADLLVVLGTLGLEDKIARLAGEAGSARAIVEVVELHGIRLLRRPGDGANTHYPIYDPSNYRVFMKALASRMQELRPECGAEYNASLRRVLARLDSVVSECRGCLAGYRAVVDIPPAQYAVNWTGVNVTVILVPEAGKPVSPSTLKRVESLLGQEGVIAVVTVDPSGNPVSKAGEWLEEKARMAGAPVLEVPAPFYPGSTLDKIEAVAREASGLARG